ncbi:MAG TPA: hypothetical protein ENK62_01115 [Chromatiales bacterium]|nr:hypothetical protein [Chromatiales bacterium]
MNHGVPPDIAAALRRALQDAQPERVIHVQSERDRCALGAVLETLEPQPEVLSPHRILAARPASPPTGTVCVTCGRMGLADQRRAEHVLARLRDLYCQRVLLVTPLDAREPHGWPEAQLRALGFLRLLRTGQAGTDWGLFGFDLYDYKTTPDWLNPRYWANPHLWNRYRW